MRQLRFTFSLCLILLMVSSGMAFTVPNIVEGPVDGMAGYILTDKDDTLKAETRNTGSLAFWFKTDKTYGGSSDFPNLRIPIISVEGLYEIRLQTAQGRAMLIWQWDKKVKGVDNLNIQIPSLPGPAWYHVAYHWDALNGVFTGYLNGTPLRVEGTKLDPWKMGFALEMTIHKSPLIYADSYSSTQYEPAEELLKTLPEKYRGNMAENLGGKFKPTVDIASRKGHELYSFAMTKPEDTKDWIMEGPGKVSYDDNGMTMVSTAANDDSEINGHIVYWMPHDLPENFVAQWTMQPISEDGLCITFFAAKGVNGEDIFDPTLKKRAGVFKQYIQSDINCYHFSYYANTPFNRGRITTNLRKNSGFYLVSNGAAGIQPGSTQPHHVMLMKDGGHIVVNVDGKTILDFTDDGKAYGPIHEGGKIGLRQMRWMQARYRDLKIFSLN
ncbi:MAG TPA: hypothetical protein DCM28_07940 [Phycisphaerales bacterium]|nr:hypothetical protein [Phycisphaerales bacterium]HCD34216.1 hypothetical protein [Phycisphaerales bacterium]|tara:strand:+ start:63673 stop:64992 length:1320 start_codon:yes stop_codon:yes gene_type:complete